MLLEYPNINTINVKLNLNIKNLSCRAYSNTIIAFKSLIPKDEIIWLDKSLQNANVLNYE
jgi:hypothetical protein